MREKKKRKTRGREDEERKKTQRCKHKELLMERPRRGFRGT